MNINKTHLVANTLFAIVCATLINTKSFAEPANLSSLKTEVIAYHDTGAYQNELTHVINQAQRYIVRRADANHQSQHPQKLAIVLDIDETSISNYNNMRKRDFSSDKKSIHQAFLQANAPAIEPMLALYQDALQHHVAVFFVTGRAQRFQETTEKNLRLAGYQTWAGLYLRPNQYAEASIIPFKSQTRAAIAHQGYTIIASIGDQASDLEGGHAEKLFKLPNPYYHVA